MEENKFNEIMDQMRSMQDQIKADREAFAAEQRAFEQEKAALTEAPSVKREKAVNGQIREIIDAMLNKRAITLNGSGAVEVINALFKAFANKTSVVDGVRFFQGPNANTVIPILSPRPARPARAAEGATSISSDSTAVLAATELKPETYVSVLPVSFEALKYCGANLESELVGVFADAFRDAMAYQMVNGRDKATYYEFLGLFNAAPAANQIACDSSGSPVMADLVELALKMQDKVMAEPTIVISPTFYAGITSAAVTGYEVYKNELIMNRTIEGVKVEVCGYAPSTTTANSIVAVGFDKGDYAVGIAADITIEPIRAKGDTNTYFQAIMGIDGKPICDANVYGLKAISG